MKRPDGELENITETSTTPAMFSQQGFTPRDFHVGLDLRAA
jgi:hypothetical protein